MLGTMKHRSHLFLATECKFAPANLLGEQMRPASRCFEYIQLELESSNLACLRLTKSTQRLRRLSPLVWNSHHKESYEELYRFLDPAC